MYKSFTNEQLLEKLQQRLNLEQIADSLQSSSGIVRKRLKKLHISTLDYRFNIHIFDEIDTEEKAYWLGFLYADGNVSTNRSRIELSLKGTDINHLYKFADFLNFPREKVKLSAAKCDNKYFSRCRIGFGSLYLKNRLIELGCVPQKSLILKFPNIEIFKTKDLVYPFIRGYVDGDGCLGIRANKTKSPTLTFQVIGTLEFLKEMCHYLNIENPNIYRKEKRHLESNTYSIFICAKNALDVTFKLYNEATIYLDRKYNIYKFAVSQSNL